MNNTQITDKDEIDFRKIFHLLWQKKMWITGFVAVVCAITVAVVLNMDNIYASRAVLRPSHDNMNQMSSLASNFGGLASLAGINLGSSGNVTPYNTMRAIVQDADFVYSFVKKNKFEPKVYDDYEDKKDKEKYKENEKYFLVKSLRESLSFSEDLKTGLITLSYENKDKIFAKQFIDLMLIELSEKYMSIEMANLQERIDNYKKEIDKTNDITLKNKLAEVVAGLIQNKVLSQAQEYYGFDILVNADISDNIDKVKPKRGLICVAMFIASLIVSIGTVIIIDTFKNKESIK